MKNCFCCTVACRQYFYDNVCSPNCLFLRSFLIVHTKLSASCTEPKLEKRTECKINGVSKGEAIVLD